MEKGIRKKGFRKHVSVDAHLETVNRYFTSCGENNTICDTSDKNWQRN